MSDVVERVAQVMRMHLYYAQLKDDIQWEELARAALGAIPRRPTEAMYLAAEGAWGSPDCRDVVDLVWPALLDAAVAVDKAKRR